MASSCASIDIEDATQHLRDILKLDRPAGGEPGPAAGWARPGRAGRTGGACPVLPEPRRSPSLRSACSGLGRAERVCLQNPAACPKGRRTPTATPLLPSHLRLQPLGPRPSASLLKVRPFKSAGSRSPAFLQLAQAPFLDFTWSPCSRLQPSRHSSFPPWTPGSRPAVLKLIFRKVTRPGFLSFPRLRHNHRPLGPDWIRLQTCASPNSFFFRLNFLPPSLPGCFRGASALIDPRTQLMGL